jgi:hypothetical protein
MRPLPLLVLLPLLAASLAAEDTPKPKPDAKPDAKAGAKPEPKQAEAGAEAAAEWRPAEARDVPAAVKQALIAESEKLAADGEIGGFGYAQTPFDAKDQRFRATFHVGEKEFVLTCKSDGTDLKNESPAAKAGAAK